MKNTEVSINYKSNGLESFRDLLMSSVTLWAIIMPGISIYAAIYGASPISVFIMLGSLLFAAVCLWLLLLASDNRIVLSRSGLRVPSRLTLFAFGREEIPWQQIEAVKVLDALDQDDRHCISQIQKRLLFKLKDQDEFEITLNQIAEKDVEKLLLSLSVWLEDEKVRPLMAAKWGQSIDIEGKDKPETYTNLWEKELESRYTSTAFMPLEPGHKLLSGKLKIIKQLSFGGLSAVYLAQKEEKELCVLKEATPPQTAKQALKDKAAELFAREAELLIKLSHPQLVKVIDYIFEDGRTYLVLNYIEGTNLRQLVRERGALEEDKALEIIASLTEPLEYMHNLSPPVVHRDISPENIILGEDGKPILIDFGAASEYLGTATGTLVGKQCYISLEQFKGKAQIASDYYSLGATLYFLLTGSDPIPLTASNPAEKRPELSPLACQLTSSLTALDLNDRLFDPIAIRNLVQNQKDIQKESSQQEEKDSSNEVRLVDR